MTLPTIQDAEVQQFLQFTLPDDTLAMIRSSHLTEVLSLDLAQIVSIPDVNSALLGVYNWRGEVLWLLDAGAYLGAEPLYQDSLGLGKVTVIIIHSQGKTLGLCIKQVDEMVTCSVEGIQTPPRAELSAALQECLDGYWLNAHQDVTWVLNASQLIDNMSG